MIEYLLVWLASSAIFAGGLWIGSSREQWLKAQLDDERARVADLHSRLAARTHGEYAAFTAEPGVEVTRRRTRTLYDDTGLIEIELPDEERPPHPED